jgi:hypothetical protein
VAGWIKGPCCATADFCGLATSIAPGGEQFEVVRSKLSLVGDGGGVWSFIHVADAAEATVVAVEQFLLRQAATS